MSEADWLGATDPLALLEALGPDADAGRLWRYVIHCLKGVGERATAEVVADLAAGDADEWALRDHRLRL